MRILIDEAIWDAARLFGELGEVRTFSGRAPATELVREADALVVRSVTRVDTALLSGSSVRFVGTATSGTDHIDAAWLAAQGIHLADAAGCNRRAVAEYVLAAILHLCRMDGDEPARRTLGVVGVGRIGSIVRDWARQIGMTVLCCDPPRQAAGAEGLVDAGELAAACDIVTLHVPLTVDGPCPTRGMVDAAWLASLRPGVRLINTSRGAIVCEADLTAALERRRVGPVVLDVWQNEPRIDARLADRATIATPHIAGYSAPARRRAATMIRDALALWRGSDAGSTAVPPPATFAPGAPLPESEPLPLSESGKTQSIQALADTLLTATGLLEVDSAFRAGIGSSDPAGAFDALRTLCVARNETTAG